MEASLGEQLEGGMDDEPRRRSLYLRYVDEGPAYPESGTLGDVCPEPDWEGARRHLWAERWESAEGLLPWVGLPAIAVAVLGALAGWRRRRP
jgi:hypothetical protein